MNYDPSYPGPVNPRGSGSGVPSQRFVGGLFGGLTPWGLGALTGPGASWGWGKFQNWLARNRVQSAVSGYQTGGDQSGQGGSTTTAPSGYGSQPVWNEGMFPEGFDPTKTYDYSPSASTGPNTTGGIGRLGSAGMGGGYFGSSIGGGNEQNFMPTLGFAMPDAGGGGAYGGNTMAKIAMHGKFRNIATPEQWAYMQNYLGGGGGGGGSGQGVGGAGRPMTESRQQGDSDVGLKLFKTAQRLQGGENEVRGKEPPFTENGKWWWEKADSDAADEEYNASIADEDDLAEQTLQRRRETAYKTVGVNINGREVEIPIWDESMTPEQAEGFARDRLEMGLSPFASDMELEAAQKNNYAGGTSSVNQGLYFYRKKLKKPKL